MKKHQININDQNYRVVVDETKPLLWVLRDELGLTGTKYGCGIAQCGACTVHINGEPVRSCVIPVSSIGDRKVTTIEGLPKDHAIFEAWEAVNVPQCGYCQAGQIMSAAALLDNEKNLDDQAIDNAMSGNICRCGTYCRIRKAIKMVEEITC